MRAISAPFGHFVSYLVDILGARIACFTDFSYAQEISSPHGETQAFATRLKVVAPLRIRPPPYAANLGRRCERCRQRASQPRRTKGTAGAKERARKAALARWVSVRRDWGAAHCFRPCLKLLRSVTKTRMRILIFLLLVTYSAKADLLFRDEHREREYIFESDRQDVAATIAQDEALELATGWAVDFYDDDLLEPADIEFRTEPLRYWLVTLKEPGTDESFYAAILPDGAIVEPRVQDKI
jgi:hypothetical protein